MRSRGKGSSTTERDPQCIPAADFRGTEAGVQIGCTTLCVGVAELRRQLNLACASVVGSTPSPFVKDAPQAASQGI